MKFSKVKQSVPALMIVIIIAKLVGMLREVVLANYFGTSNVSDAYLIASSVPTLLFYFIGHSISTSYIPMYNKVKNDLGEKSSIRYTNYIINIAMIFATVFVAILLIWPEIVIKLFASGFNAETVSLTAKLIRISAVSMYLMILVNVLGGYLNANKNFIVPAAVSLPRNAMIIISIVIAAKLGYEWLGIGLLCAYVAECILIVPFAFNKGYRYKPNISFKDKYVQETWYVIVPILIGMFVGQINKIIDKSIASNVVEGGISALTYASVINTAVQEVLVTGLITVLFSKCAEWVVKGEHDKVKKQLSSTLNTLAFFLIPATIGVIILARPIVTLVLGRGAFDENSTTMTVGALCFYTSGLFFLAARDTLVKVFYAYKETKITTVTSILAIVLKIVLSLILYKIMGLNGLAFSTAISAVFNSIVLYVLFNKRIGDVGFKSLVITMIKTFISCAGMALTIYGLNLVVTGLNSMVMLVLSVLAGMLIYFVISLILKQAPLMDMLGKIKKQNIK